MAWVRVHSPYCWNRHSLSPQGIVIGKKPPFHGDILRKITQNNHQKGESPLKRSILVLAVTAGILAVMAAFSPRLRGETPLQVPAARVISAPVRTTVTLRGTVREQCRRAVYPTGASVVTAVYTAVGDTVRAGQPLLEMTPCDSNKHLGETETQALKDLLLAGDAEGALSALEAALSAQPAAREAYTVTSPISGTVMALAGLGESLSGLLPCGQVSDLSALCVEAQAGESVVGQLAPGMDCTVQVPALSSRVFRGSVDTVEPYAAAGSILSGDQSPMTQVQVALVSSQTDLRPGYSATVKVITSTEPSALWIPYPAVGQEETGQEYVLTVENGRAVRRAVTLGAEDSELVQVLSGLTAGETVLLTPEEVPEGRCVIGAFS